MPTEQQCIAWAYPGGAVGAPAPQGGGKVYLGVIKRGICKCTPGSARVNFRTFYSLMGGDIIAENPGYAYSV